MITDPTLKKLVEKQTADFNNNSPEEVRIKNFVDIVKRQKERVKESKGGEE